MLIPRPSSHVSIDLISSEREHLSISDFPCFKSLARDRPRGYVFIVHTGTYALPNATLNRKCNQEKLIESSERVEMFTNPINSAALFKLNVLI